MAGFDLERITLDDSQVRKYLSKEVADRLTANITKSTLNGLAKLALFAYQSKIPIDTGELRNYIQVDFATNRNPVARIYLVQTTHLGRDRKPIGSLKLADLLNIGTNSSGGSMSRSRDSKAIAPYSSVGHGFPTENWIPSARIAFANTRRKYLRGLN